MLLPFACALVGVESQNHPAVQLPANLDPVFRTYPAELDRYLKAVGLGIASFSKGEYATSLDALRDDNLTRNTALGDYVLFYRAKANLSLDRDAEALRDFHLFQSQFPDSPLYPDAILGKCQADLKLHNPAAVLAALRNPRIEESADVLYLQGRALEDLGERQKAMDLYFRVYCNYVNSVSAAPAQEHLTALSPRALTGTYGYKPLLARADNLLRVGRNREAQILLQRLGRIRAPDKLSAERRALLYADAVFRLKRTTSALSLVRNISSADPALHARAIYLEGACYRRLKREESFLKMRDKALGLYPKSSYTEQLLAAVASEFDVENEIDKAQEAYESLYGHFPKGESAERALWRMSLFSYVKKQYGAALQGFYRFLRAYPDPGRAIPAIYWMGRCYQGLGDVSHATCLLDRIRTLACDSYYSERASEAESALKRSAAGEDRPFAGLDFDEVAKAMDGVRLSLNMVGEPSAAASGIIERARQLVAAELPDLALSELRRGVRRFPSETSLSYVMSRVNEMKGDYYGVISTLRHAFPDYNDRPPDSLPGEIWELLFPVKYWDVISRQAAKNHIDPNLVLGIIRQESAFKEGARSSANARGLMQVLPSTGRRVARQAGVSRYTVKKLYSAETNIVLGIEHLSSMLRQYNGNVELALSAYNAGDDRADRWMREFGLADMAEFVERVPFSETRGYIKQVLTNKAHYALQTAALAGKDR